MRFSRNLVTFVVLAISAVAVWASDSDVVVSDSGVDISRIEFARALQATAPKIREAAAKDLGDRLELINSMLYVRKLAKEADEIGPADEDYWDLQFKLMGVKQKHAFDKKLGSIKVPNVEGLAREYYKTQKVKYATRPETRASSHILLASRPGLPREGVRAEAQAILDELRAGASFEDAVAEHSDDKGTAKRKGSLDKWIRFGDPSITPPYSEALFQIEEVGGYSEITDSQFGIHIIRLDGIKEGGFYEYEEVKPVIMGDIVADFRALTQREIKARYEITDSAVIDGKAMEELFAPYKD